jgi:hypothetical protein
MMSDNGGSRTHLARPRKPSIDLTLEQLNELFGHAIDRIVLTDTHVSNVAVVFEHRDLASQIIMLVGENTRIRVFKDSGS